MSTRHVGCQRWMSTASTSDNSFRTNLHQLWPGTTCTTKHCWQSGSCLGFTRVVYIIPGRGALPLLTVVGTCRWTGYDFLVITIDTGYLTQPNWLLAGYSVYHRVASQPTMFMTGPRSRHQRRDASRRCVPGRNRLL